MSTAALWLVAGSLPGLFRWALGSPRGWLAWLRRRLGQ